MRSLFLGTAFVYCLVGGIVILLHTVGLLAQVTSNRLSDHWEFALLATVLAGGVAAIEILSRYRDEPFTIIRQSKWSWIYLLVNALLGLLAFAILSSTNTIETDSAALAQSTPSDTTPATPKPAAPQPAATQPAATQPADPESADTATTKSTKDSITNRVPANTYWMLAFTAGLGAATVIRARVFTVRVGTQDIAIGPGFVVDQLLNVLDREIDRRQAQERVNTVRRVLSEVQFSHVVDHVHNMITGGRQNLSPEDGQELARRIGDIRRNETFDEQEKAYALGFLILDFMGPAFLDLVFDEEFWNMRRAQLLLEEQEDTQAIQNTLLVETHLQNVSLTDLTNRLINQQVADSLIDEINEQTQRLATDPTLEQSCVFALGFAAIEKLGPEAFEQIMTAP
jgi:hypothetical protein